MGNETSKNSPRRFESMPALYKCVLEETFHINCQLNEEILRRYNTSLFLSIQTLAVTLFGRYSSKPEIQEMNTSFEKVLKHHMKRAFEFTHKKCKGRYQKFPEDIIKKAHLKDHKIDNIPADISEFASDFGTDENKFNVFLYGKKEDIKNKLEFQIKKSMTNLLPELTYKRKICSEALCVDGGEGKVMRYKVSPVEAEFFPGNPYTVKPVKQDLLEICESTCYVWVENGRLYLSENQGTSNANTFLIPTLVLKGSVLVELEGTIEFSCTKEVKVATEKDGKASQIILWPINKIVQSKASKSFKYRVKVEIEMTPAFLKSKLNKNIKVTCNDVENFNKLRQEVLSLEVCVSMFSQNEEENETSSASSFNRTSTSRDSQNNRNQNDSEINPHVQSNIQEDLPSMGTEFASRFRTKIATGLATKLWDDVGEIVALTASKTAGRVLQRLLIPVGIAWWSYNIWHFVKDYRENKITLRELIRRVGRYAITDIGTTGLACLISTLVAGPVGFLVGIGLAAVLSPLDYFLGDRISKCFLRRSPEEEKAWRTEQLLKRKQCLLKKAYKLLEIDEHASNWEVDRAYRNAAKNYHPRHRAEDVDNKFDAINKAYNIIKEERSLEAQGYGARNNTIRPIQAITEG